MKFKMLALGALIFTGFAMNDAQAIGNGVLTTLSGTMTQMTTKAEGGPEQKSESLLGDLKIGYLNGNGLYLGGLYGFGNFKDTDDSKIEQSNFGASIGYIGASGFYLMGHYIFSAEVKDSLEEGNGFQVDLGYLSKVTNNFVVGVEMVYKSVDYKTVGAGSKFKKTDLFPMLTLGFMF